MAEVESERQAGYAGVVLAPHERWFARSFRLTEKQYAKELAALHPERVRARAWIFIAHCSTCDDVLTVPPGQLVEVHAAMAHEDDILVSMEIDHAIKGCNGRLSWGEKP